MLRYWLGGAQGERGVWMGVGCHRPPVCNNMVTPRFCRANENQKKKQYNTRFSGMPAFRQGCMGRHVHHMNGLSKSRSWNAVELELWEISCRKIRCFFKKELLGRKNQLSLKKSKKQRVKNYNFFMVFTNWKSWSLFSLCREMLGGLGKIWSSYMPMPTRHATSCSLWDIVVVSVMAIKPLRQLP